MGAETSNFDAIFCAAIAIASAQDRAAYIARACGSDSELRDRVGRLVNAHFRAGSFMEVPAVGSPSPIVCGEQGVGDVTTDPAPMRETPGAVIDDYKLLEQIGEGGFGIVFMAEQTQPVRRKVALKVLKPGMDTRQVIARFEAERQALALMDHPNIARVLDAGQTSSGRPYFVMDLVKGLPITDFCDQNRLMLRERLELFVSVCQAVQHAHQKGIIHRDLKPSNILVESHDGKPVPKVIDFGVAKALGQSLTERTVYTAFAQMVGTPLYMSPEQAGMSSLDIDTRSDVYSLGVLLYELLTGTTPFAKEKLQEAGYDEMRRIIREEEPPRPSTRLSTLGKAETTVSGRRQSDPKRLSRLVRGELDWIVMKCLEKDRNRRYETTNGLSRDVERYLADEPVQACPPSPFYRLRKFVRRRKVSLAFAGLILGFLVVLGGGVGWVVGDRAAREQVREREAEVALNKAEGLLEQGQWPEATAWAKRARVVLDGGQVRPGLYQRLEEIQADLTMVERLAEIHIQRSNVRDERFDLSGGDLEYVAAFQEYGIEVETLGVQEAAKALRARRIWLALVLALDDWHYVRRNLNPDERSWKHLLAVAQAADADELRNQLRHALVTRLPDRKVLARLAASNQLAELPAATLVLLGRFLDLSREVEKAVTVLRQAQRRFPNDIWINHDLGYYLMRSPHWQEALPFLVAAQALRPESPGVRINLSLVLAKKGEHAWDLAVCQEAVRLKPDYAAAWTRLGGAHRDLGQHDKALAAFSKAIVHKGTDAGAWYGRGEAHSHLGQPDKALADFNKAIELKQDFAEAWCGRGFAHNELGQPGKALADFNKAIELKGNDAKAWYNRGVAHSDLGRQDKALADYSEAIRLEPDFASAWHNRGITHARLGQHDKALADFSRAIELKPAEARSWANRGGVYGELGQYDKALADFSRALELKADFPEAWCDRGNVYIQLNQLARAIADYSRAIKSKPDFAEAWHNRGASYLKRGQNEKALFDLSRATQLKPDYLDAWNKRGIAHHNLKQYDKAVFAYSRALELQPDYAYAWENRGRAYNKLGKWQDALKDFQHYRKLTRDGHRALNELAWFLATCPDVKLRDPKQAVELAKKAVELAPDAGSNWNTLGVAHYRAGDWKAAVTTLEKAVQLRSGGTGSDWFFLAMSHWKLNSKDRARQAYDRAVRWMDKHAAQDEEQRRFRAEAAELLGIEEGTNPQPKRNQNATGPDE
jgi:tetratricopeptide (TPR) repeat protein